MPIFKRGDSSKQQRFSSESASSSQTARLRTRLTAADAVGCISVAAWLLEATCKPVRRLLETIKEFKTIKLLEEVPAEFHAWNVCLQIVRLFVAFINHSGPCTFDQWEHAPIGRFALELGELRNNLEEILRFDCGESDEAHSSVALVKAALPLRRSL